MDFQIIPKILNRMLTIRPGADIRNMDRLSKHENGASIEDRMLKNRVPQGALERLEP